MDNITDQLDEASFAALAFLALTSRFNVLPCAAIDSFCVARLLRTLVLKLGLNSVLFFLTMLKILLQSALE